MAGNTENEFRELGGALAAARIAAGLAKQSDLAGILSVSQQTVSRWEAGVAKPKEKQLLALAAVLKLNVADLRRLTHDEGVSAVGYVEPFPVDRLDPTTFESFVADLVQAAHPQAEVRRAGDAGHTQDGLDVDVTFPDGRRMGLQCKRVQRFGPADAKAAISAFPASGFEKVLVLSLVTSPQTAKTMKAAGWRVWDKDDLSRRVRRLPVEAQERLVDIYFRGQRLALIGRSEPGPWLTTEEFFRPFAGTDSLLSHGWNLLGRESEMDELLAALVRPGMRMVLLVAAGGMGKSRLLKESMALLAQSEPFTRIRFLSSAADLSPGALDDLGPGPKVIVVDDAHDRGRLGVLFEYASDHSRQVRLVLATRPYALDRIKHEAARFNLTSLPTITLDKLSRKQLRAFAGQIMSRFDIDDEEYARYVVAASGASPLIVAMASRALAKDRIPIEIAQNEGAFRDIVLSRFKEIAVHIADAGEEGFHRDVLEMLALVQPFHPEDRQLLEALEQVHGLSKEIVSRILDRFAKGGVIYRRGHEWRLMPDVLGDYLIETTCRDSAGRLSVFADKVLDTVRDALLKHALINLGRLDWRLNAGDTANSTLLSEVWRKFDDIEDEFDPRLDVIKSIALYQPRQALDFIIRQARRKRKMRAFSAILSGIAQTSEYVRDVMMLLWEFGRTDDRELGPHPDHPLRVLSDLGDYGGRKPLTYSEALLNLGLDLMENASNWKGRYTPLDVLKPLLSLEGTNNSSDGRTIYIKSYYVNYEVIRPVRMSVIEIIIKYLYHIEVFIAHAAACMLESAVRYPACLMGSAPPEDLHTALSKEFTDTFGRVESAMNKGVHPIVALGIARSISWNAKYGNGRSSIAAQKILDSFPNDIEFRVLATLVDGWETLFSDWEDSERWQFDLDHRLATVASDLKAAKPDVSDCLGYLQQLLSQLETAGESLSSTHMLVHKLVQDDAFARVLIEDALTRRASITRTYVGSALAFFMQKHKDEGRSYIHRFVDSGDRDLSIAAVKAYSANRIENEDKIIIQNLLISSDPDVVNETLRMVGLCQTIEDRERIRLLLSANYAQSERIVDSLAMILCSKNSRWIEILSEVQVADLLRRIISFKKFEGYWMDEMLAELSYRLPFVTADFFMRRVELAEELRSYGFRAANFGPYSRKPLRFLESSEVADVLERVWRWLTKNGGRGHYFHYAAAHMVEAMFLRSATMLVEFFRPKLSTADEDQLKIIGRLFREAVHTFVFDQVGFVIELLDRCQTVSFDLYQEVASHLYASERSGVRTSVPGEPSPRDLETQDKADKILTRLSRLSPAYELFDNIRKSALADIDRAKRDAAAFDD